MPATELEQENASDGAAAGQVSVAGPGHLGGKRKREGAALHDHHEEARVLRLAQSPSTTSSGATGGDEPETGTELVDELRSFREFAAREEPGLSRVSTRAMGEIWAEAAEEARARPAQFRQFAQGQAVAKRMRAHAAVQGDAGEGAGCVAKASGGTAGCSGRGLECAGGHHTCHACLVDSVAAACGAGGRAAAEVVCAATGAVSAAGQLPCALFGSGDCGVAALPEAEMLRQLAHDPAALKAYSEMMGQLAHQRAEREAQAATMTECAICLDAYSEAAGMRCGGAKSHFLCNATCVAEQVRLRRGFSDCRFAAHLNHFIPGSIIFSGCFSKVTIGFIPRCAPPARRRPPASAASSSTRPPTRVARAARGARSPAPSSAPAAAARPCRTRRSWPSSRRRRRTPGRCGSTRTAAPSSAPSRPRSARPRGGRERRRSSGGERRRACRAASWRWQSASPAQTAHLAGR